MTSPDMRTPILAVLIGLLFSQASWAATVSGQFQLDGNTMTPTSVAAVRVRDQMNPREFATYVMLTSKPVNLDAIAKDTDPYVAAINDEAMLSADHLSFTVKADGTVGMNASVGGTQYIDSSGALMGEPGSLVATCTTNTPEHVACSVKSAKTVKTMDGNSWNVEVKFDSDVRSRAPGKPLPKDGGEPGKALLALIKAAEGDDFAKIIALLSPSQVESFQHDYNTPAENLASAKQIFEFTLPKQPKITGGELSDENTALVEVEGVPYPDSRILYIVTLQRTDGRWGYVSSQRAGMLN